MFGRTFVFMGGSHGLVVMGGVSCSEGRGFEKEAGDGPFKKRFTEGAPED